MERLSAYLTLVVALAFALAPAVTNPFSGFEADQLPIPQIDPPIQPAGYAFSIWGVIYIWLFVSAVYGAWKRSTSTEWTRARWPLIVSMTIGVPWLAIANASAIWATVAIILMAFGAIAALIVAPTRDRWLFQAPVAIYAGWLTAASCVSLGTTMAGYGVLFASIGWAYVGIGTGLVTAITVFRQRRQAPEYLFAVIWALFGIVVANGTDIIGVSVLSGLGILALVANIYYPRWRPSRAQNTR
jgi:hypothetical protein